MNIIVCRGDSFGCGYYRMVVPYSHLGPNHKVILVDRVVPELFEEADLIVGQRFSTPEMLKMVEIIKAKGKPLIMDIDDNLFTLNNDNAAAETYGTGRQGTRIFQEVVPQLSAFTVSTKRLEVEYAKIRPQNDTYVLENILAEKAFGYLTPDMETLGKLKCPPEVRIGYAGSSSHGNDLMIMTKPLTKLCEKYPQVKLVFFGQFPNWLGHLSHRSEYHPFVDPDEKETPVEFMARYYQTLKGLDLDIAFVPIQPNVFNLCKSSLKCIEYGAVGWPLVASRLGPYSDYDNRSGGGCIKTVFNEDYRAWINRLGELIEDEGLRRTLALKNWENVRDHYTTQTGLQPWLDLIAAFDTPSPHSGPKTPPLLVLNQ